MSDKLPRIGKITPLVGDYKYQIIKTSNGPKGFNRGYVKVWLGNEVIDRALTLKVARARAKKHMRLI